MASDNTKAAQSTGPQFKSLHDEFLAKSRRHLVTVGVPQTVVDNGRLTFQLPNAGMLETIYVRLTGTIGVISAGGSVNAGTIANAPNAAPFNLFRRVRFGSTNAINLRDHAGSTWYQWLRDRMGFDFRVRGSSDFLAPVNQKALGLTTANRLVAGAAVPLITGTTTYQVDVMVPMPIAYNYAGDYGYILLQGNDVFYKLELDMANVFAALSTAGGTSEMFAGLGVAGGGTLTYSLALTVSVAMAYRDYLQGCEPLTQTYMTLYDSYVTQGVNTGLNIIPVPQDDLVTWLAVEVQNNNSVLTTINNLEFRHSGSILDMELADPTFLVADNYFRKNGTVLTDGLYSLDLGAALGDVDRRDVFDAYLNSQVTATEVRFTIPAGTSMVTPQVKLIKEVLHTQEAA